MSVEITQTINHVDVYQRPVETLVIETPGPQGPPGATYSFTVAGNSGPSQTINNGDTLTLTSPVSFQQVVMSADTATFSWPNQTGNTFLASPADGSSATPSFRTVVVADIAIALNTGGVPAIFTNLTVNGNTILGDNSADTLTFNASTLAIPNNLNIDSNTFFIDAANNRVGIGTTTFTAAATKLQIAGNRMDMLATNTGPFFRITSSDSIAVEYGVTSGAGYLGTDSGHPLYFRVSSTARGGIDTGGSWVLGASPVGFAASYRAHILRLSSATSTQEAIFAINHNTSGTPAAGFGSLMTWFLESSTTENRLASISEVSWATATDASRAARKREIVYDTAAREYLRGEASGSAPMIGFLGANAVIRQALGAWAGLTTDQKLDALRDALTNLGLTSFT